MERMTTSKPTHRRQAGFILPFALVLLVLLIMLSAGFFNRSADSALFSGSARDSSQAMLLAESALNRLYGQFANGKNVDGLNGVDKDDIKDLPVAMATPPSPLNVKYLFYRTGGAGIDQTGPDLLQRVANGEARNTGATLTTQGLANGTTMLKTNNLFVSSAMRPMLYVRDSTGLSASSATSWDAETGAEKVAVWIELTRNATHSGWLDVYVQAVAQVGAAKAYVQRYIGAYTDNLGGAPVLGEGGNHG